MPEFGVLRVFDVRAVFGRFGEEINAVKDASVRRSRIHGIQAATNHTIATACYVGTLIVAAFLVEAKKSDFGSVMAIITLQQYFNHMLTAIGEYLASLQESLAGTARVFEMLDAEEERASIISPHAEADALPAAVELRSVAFRYEEQKSVLSDVSLRIPEGSFAAIVGEAAAARAAS